MEYSKEFIDEVKRFYPNDETIHKLADSGSVYLGAYLENSPTSISMDEILLSISLEDLQEKARDLKRKYILLQKWRDIHKQQIQTT